MTSADDTPAETAPPSRRGRPVASSGDRHARIANIERAVVACVESMSVGDISIDEIVRHAGISRRTFYRFFDSRRAVLAHVLQQRAVAIAARVRAYTAACDDFATAVVEGSMATLRLIAADPVFTALADADSHLMLDIMSIDLAEPGGPLFFATWADVFARGRASGALRPTISNGEAADWLRNVHYLLSLRSDLSDADKRALLVAFVMPSLTLSEG